MPARASVLQDENLPVGGLHGEVLGAPDREVGRCADAQLAGARVVEPGDPPAAPGGRAEGRPRGDPLVDGVVLDGGPDARPRVERRHGRVGPERERARRRRPGRRGG